MAEPQEEGFADKIRVNVVSWLVIAAIGGVAYVAYTVPRQIDHVIRNQEELKAGYGNVVKDQAILRTELEVVKDVQGRVLRRLGLDN